VEDDNVAKTDAINIEAIEDMEDIETSHLHSVSGQSYNSNISLSVSKNDKKETLSDVKQVVKERQIGLQNWQRKLALP